MTLPSALPVSSGSGHAFLLRVGLACGYLRLSRWQHRAISGASAREQIGGWRDGSGLGFMGIETTAAPSSEPGVDRGPRTSPLSQRLPDRGLDVAVPFPIVGWYEVSP